MGCGFAKFLKSKEMWPNYNIPDVLRVYYYLINDSVLDIKKITDSILLLPPLAILGSNSIKKNGWHVVGNEKINENDFWLPYVKSKWPPFGESKEWVSMQNLGQTSTMKFCDYTFVKHLEYSRVIDITLIPFRIQLEYAKLLKKDFKNEYGKFSWLEELEYNQSYDIPPFVLQDNKIKGIPSCPPLAQE